MWYLRAVGETRDRVARSGAGGVAHRWGLARPVRAIQPILHPVAHDRPSRPCAAARPRSRVSDAVELVRSGCRWRMWLGTVYCTTTMVARAMTFDSLLRSTKRTSPVPPGEQPVTQMEL